MVALSLLNVWMARRFPQLSPHLLLLQRQIILLINRKSLILKPYSNSTSNMSSTSNSDSNTPRYSHMYPQLASITTPRSNRLRIRSSRLLQWSRHYLYPLLPHLHTFFRPKPLLCLRCNHCHPLRTRVRLGWPQLSRDNRSIFWSSRDCCSNSKSKSTKDTYKKSS